MFAAIDALALAGYFTMPQFNLGARERNLITIRRKLDVSTFDNAWDAGTRLSLDEAVVLAFSG